MVHFNVILAFVFSLDYYFLWRKMSVYLLSDFSVYFSKLLKAVLLWFFVGSVCSCCTRRLV